MPLLLRADGSMVFPRGGQLILRAPGGDESQLPCASEVQSLMEMSSNWLALQSTEQGVQYGVSAGEVFLLPGDVP